MFIYFSFNFFICFSDLAQARCAGEVVAVRYERDQRWYRAKIVDTHPDAVNHEYTVYFVDYGYTSNVGMVEMRQLQPQFLHLPFQVK